MASKITSLTIVYSIVYSGANQRKHQSSLSLAFVRGIHRWPMNSPPKGPVTRKMFPFDYVILIPKYCIYSEQHYKIKLHFRKKNCYSCLRLNLCFLSICERGANGAFSSWGNNKLHTERKRSNRGFFPNYKVFIRLGLSPCHQLTKIPFSPQTKNETHKCWCYDMETLTAFMVLCKGNHPITGGFSSQRANNGKRRCFLCYSPE